jgi:hypothetical protein
MEKTLINIGDFVKFRLNGPDGSERVWGEVVDSNKEHQTLTCRIDNHPVVTSFKFGEEVTIPCHFVLDKHKDTQPEEE